jgi:pimeloyl-ACP methyl ester carboxylesterase
MPAVIPLPRKEAWLEVEDHTPLWYSLGGAALGERAPVVLCDGIGCDGYAWRYLAPHLAARYPVLHWNYRGHGQSGSPRDPEAVTIPHLADDLAGILDHAGIEKAVLVGHSMGVQVILEAYRRHPSRVLGLVPICGSYGRPLATFHDTGVATSVVPLLRELVLRFPKEAQAVWSKVTPSRFALTFALLTELNRRLVSEGDFFPYLQHLANIDVTCFFRMLRYCGEHTARDLLPQIGVPALVVAGAKDSFTPGWLGREMARRIPGAELLLIPWGTHTAPIEVPELLNLRVEKFLRERIESSGQRPRSVPAGRAPEPPGPPPKPPGFY